MRMTAMLIILIFIILVGLVEAQPITVYFVDKDEQEPGYTHNCIQDAINDVYSLGYPRAIINVKPDTYDENIEIDCTGDVYIQLRSDPNADIYWEPDPEATVIRGLGNESVIKILNEGSGTNGEAHIIGFTITNGNAPGGTAGHGGGGIYCENASPEIWYNIIHTNKAENYSTGNGGGIMCGAGSSPIIGNNLIYDNESYRGGAIYCGSNSNAIILNNTIAMNTATSINGVNCFGCDDINIINTIFWNPPEGMSDYREIGSTSGSVVNISYCMILGSAGTSIWTQTGGTWTEGNEGEGVLWGQETTHEPLFVDLDTRDFHLSKKDHNESKVISPCVNRGVLFETNSPFQDFDMDNNIRPYEGNVDIGAYEYSAPLPLKSNDYEIYDDDPVVTTVILTLNSGSENVGRPYLMLGSLSGTIPGVSVGQMGGGTMLPLNPEAAPGIPDPLYLYLVTNYASLPGFYGTLTAGGMGQLTFDYAPGQMAQGSPDAIMSYAYLIGEPIDYASNPVKIVIKDGTSK